MRESSDRQWMGVSRVGPLLVWLCSVLWAGVCAGDSLGELRLQQPLAQRYWSQSRDAFASRGWRKAQQQLELAYGLERNPELLRALAQTADMTGEKWLAIELYRRYLAEVPSAAATAPQLVARIAQAEPELGQVIVRGDSDALLCVDGRLVGALRSGWTLWLEPKTHELVLGCPERRQGVEIRTELEPPVLVGFFDGVATKERAPPVLASFDGQPVPGPELEPVVAALRRELLQQEHHLWSAARLARELSLLPPSCLADRACGLKLARRLEARFWFVFSLPAAAGQSWHVEVINVAAGVSCASDELPCRDCSSAAATPPSVLIDLLRAARERGTGKLQLSSEPAAAQLFVDQEAGPVGQTPGLMTLLEGPHRLILRKPGYLTRAEQVTIVRDQVLDLPQPLSLQINQAARRRDRLARLKGSLLGLGILAVVGGVVALGVDHQLQRDVYDETTGVRVQREVLVSWPYGVAALCTGVVILTGSGLAWWQQRRVSRTASAAEW